MTATLPTSPLTIAYNLTALVEIQVKAFRVGILVIIIIIIIGRTYIGP